MIQMYDRATSTRAVALELIIDGTEKWFRILRLDTMQVRISKEDALCALIREKMLIVDNLTINNHRIVGTNGSISRLPRKVNGEPENSETLIIINEIENFGYFVSDCNGNTMSMTYEEAIQYANTNGIANGKVVITGNKAYISSINGKYHLDKMSGADLIKVRATNAKLQTLDVPYRITEDFGIRLLDNNMKTLTIIGARKIQESAFELCNKLEEIKIIGNQIELCKLAFAHMDNLREVQLPDGIKAIPAKAFEGSGKLKKVNIPDSVTKIGEEAFISCHGIERIELPDSILNIGAQLFRYCYDLEYVKLPSKLKEITPFMFNNCTSLKSIDLPDSILAIYDFAFSECESLEEIRIPRHIMMIQNSAFTHCEKLKVIYMPKELNTERFEVRPQITATIRKY